MAQKTIKKHEVWLTCEQWRFQRGTYSEVLNSDLGVYPTHQEALEAWAIKRNGRKDREGCKVSSAEIEDEVFEDSEKKWYVYTNSEGESYLIMTIFVRKYYYK